jgi:hypothetical protein
MTDIPQPASAPAFQVDEHPEAVRSARADLDETERSDAEAAALRSKIISVHELDDEAFKWRVTTRGGTIEGWPLNFDDLSFLTKTFPVLSQLSGIGKEIKPEDIVAVPGSAIIIGQAVACTTRAPREKWAATVNKAATNFSASEQLEIVIAIFRASWPGGWRPFVAMLETLKEMFPVADQSASSSQSSEDGELVSFVPTGTSDGSARAL